MTAEERELQNRSLRREINERVAELSEGFNIHASEPLMTLVCECGSDECLAPIELTFDEYQAVRAGAGRWVISSDHIDTTVEIIARRNGYALIENAPDLLSPEAPSPKKEPTSPLTLSLPER